MTEMTDIARVAISLLLNNQQHWKMTWWDSWNRFGQV